MTQDDTALFRAGLSSRRRRLEDAIAASGGNRRLEKLLDEVEAALAHLDDGTFGLCEVCHEPIEVDRLAADPLVRVCLDHLSPAQQQALEDDLRIASEIQKGLLPRRDLSPVGWEAAYHYRAAGPVSGDYCDLLGDGDSFHFMVGDVSGKGVAAAMLMTHLHATLRTLVSQPLSLDKVMARASRLFCESSLPTHFATLALGKATAHGEIELCIAGHLPVLVAGASGVRRVDATGLPLGVLCNEEFSVVRARLDPGECLVLYTDGVSECLDPSGAEYGIDRLAGIAERSRNLSAADMIASCIADLDSFRSGTATADDVTLMVLRRVQSVAGAA